jgi:AbrB family looped-hinge helix DNA binding protein
MTITISGKGQVTIPRELRKSLGIHKGDVLIAELDSQHRGILLRPATVLPLESYSETRLAEFAVEDKMTSSERQRLETKLAQ